MLQRYKNIKETKEYCFQEIKRANEILKEIRESCDHPREFYEKVTYMTRPGQYWDNTTICGICGELVKWPWEEVAWLGQGELDDLSLDEINKEIENHTKEATIGGP